MFNVNSQKVDSEKRPKFKYFLEKMAQALSDDQKQAKKQPQKSPLKYYGVPWVFVQNTKIKKYHHSSSNSSSQNRTKLGAAPASAAASSNYNEQPFPLAAPPAVLVKSQQYMTHESKEMERHKMDEVIDNILAEHEESKKERKSLSSIEVPKVTLTKIQGSGANAQQARRLSLRSNSLLNMLSGKLSSQKKLTDKGPNESFAETDEKLVTHRSNDHIDNLFVEDIDEHDSKNSSSFSNPDPVDLLAQDDIKNLIMETILEEKPQASHIRVKKFCSKNEQPHILSNIVSSYSPYNHESENLPSVTQITNTMPFNQEAIGSLRPVDNTNINTNTNTNANVNANANVNTNANAKKNTRRLLKIQKVV